jgi:hypothetical protein
MMDIRSPGWCADGYTILKLVAIEEKGETKKPFCEKLTEGTEKWL